jgi:tetratricopeptide (TPR) repeat protein
VTTLIAPEAEAEGPDMNAVIGAAMAGPWRIIHIAGHGEPPQAGTRVTGGLVLSDDSYLGPKEIGALRVIPELVFVNCCHLAASLHSPLSAPAYDRAAFASGVAEALIGKGVKCVVAAGWAVDDGAAEVFARTFYTRLMNGAVFIDAVAAAREAATMLGGNTWAAYQCYGDPDWRFRSRTSDAQGLRVPVSPAQELAGIASAPALQLALETIAVKTEFQSARPDEQADRLRFLEESTRHLWRDSGALQEAFGHAWAKMGRFDEAIAWYDRARTAADGKVSLAALEQLANMTVRRAWRLVSQAHGDREVMTAARDAIAHAMSLLDTTIAVGSTAERESLYGSAYKRLALIEGAAGHRAKEIQAIEQMRARYAEAERIALARLKEDPTGRIDLFYSAMNRMAADVALAGGTTQADRLDDATFDEIRQSMAAAPPDFWTVVGQTELSVFQSILAHRVAKDLSRLTREFKEHHTRVDAPKMWASVYDNATFVLSKYQARASKAEAGAAALLLAALAKLAGQTPAAGHTRTSSRPARRRTRSK